MSIFSKLLGVINLDRKSKVQPATPSPDAIKKAILDEVPVLTKKLDSSVVVNGVKADIGKNVELGLERQLRTRQFGIKFVLTPKMRAIVHPEIIKNVSLIQDLPSQYFTEVEELVMRSVAAGGDLKTLSIELHERFGITRDRAAWIATNQNRKVTAVMRRERALECGLTRAVWTHMRSQHPRQSHIDANGREYDVAKGCLIDGEYIQPGQLDDCHCAANLIFPWSSGKKDTPLAITDNASPSVVASVHKDHRERLAAQGMLRGLMAHWDGWRSMQGDDVTMKQRQFFIQYGIDVLSAQGLNKTDSIALSAKIMATLREANVEFTLDANG